MSSSDKPNEAYSKKVSKNSDAPRLDLRKYRTTELVDRIGQILGIKNVIGRFLTSQLIIFVLFNVVCFAIFWTVEPSWLRSSLFVVYALVAGIVLGAILGILRIVYDSLTNVDEILAIVLNIATSAAEDVDSVQSGSQRMPSARQLIGQVYDDVVSPAIGKVIDNQVPFVGGLVFWFYRKTIGGAIRFLFVNVELVRMGKDETEKLEENVSAGIEAAGSYASFVKATISPISSSLQSVTKGLRFYIMRPFFWLYLFLLAMAVAPVLLLRWFY